LENIVSVIEGCIRQDSKCQRLFYNLYRGFAFKLVFRYIYRLEKATDIVTDGFVKAFRSFDEFKMPANGDAEKLVMGWLKKIMINSAIDELRKNNMLPEIGAIEKNIWEISDKNDDADKLLLYADLIMLVKELPPVYRAVFNLYVMDGYSHVEIAEKLNMAVGTSKSCLSRAKALLQERINQMENEKLCRI
jgi:RNA polymerase sigma factor (sigma-70 family)